MKINKNLLPVSSNPIDIYNSKVITGKIKFDKFQLATLIRLKPLHRKLISYIPPIELLSSLKPIDIPKRRSFIDRLFSKSKSKKEIEIENEKSLIKLLTGVEALDSLQTPKGILLYGQPGSGKSFLIDIFFQSIPTDRKLRIHYHAFISKIYKLIWEETKFRNSYNFLQNNFNSLSLHTSVSFSVARHLFLNYGHILHLDEFQMVDISSAVLLRDILTHYLKFGGVLFLTSNKRPSEVYAKGVGQKNLSDFLYALERRCENLQVDNEIDYRFANSSYENNRSWFINDRMGFEEEKTKSLSESPIKSKVLNIYNRPFEINICNETVAYFTFDDICDKALGPSDYLALTSTFHTIIIDNVKVLTLHQKNQARRFITLIDAIYESKCRLIVYAQDIPQNLFFNDNRNIENDSIEIESLSSSIEVQSSPHVYSAGSQSYKNFNQTDDVSDLAVLSGEDELFAFRRAVSRLIEISSDGWLENHPDQWIKLPANVRVWETSNFGNKTHINIVNKDQEKCDGDGVLQRNSTPKFPDYHIWGMYTPTLEEIEYKERRKERRMKEKENKHNNNK